MISWLNDIVEKDLYELIEVFMMNLFWSHRDFIKYTLIYE